MPALRLPMLVVRVLVPLSIPFWINGEVCLDVRDVGGVETEVEVRET